MLTQGKGAPGLAMGQPQSGQIPESEHAVSPSAAWRALECAA